MRGSENLANPAIETLNHAIGLRVFGLDQTVLNAFCLTYLIKRMLAGGFAFSVGDKAIRKLFTIIRQHLGDDKRRLLVDGIRNTHYPVNYTFSTYSTNDRSPLHTSRLHTSRLFLCAIDKAYTILMLEGISLTLDFVVGQAI